MRTTFAIPMFLLLVLCGCRTAPTPQVTTVSPEPAPVTITTAPLDPLLQRGIDNYRAGRYAEAVTDLRSAADALLTPEQMRTYVSTGQFASLANFETAVIYLTMAYAKLGKDAEAREQVHRLLVAEQIHPTYATLPLTADVAEFENVAKRVAPSAQLPGNTALAALGTATVPAAVPVPAATVETRMAAEKASIDREVERRIAEARKDADQRYAAERAAIQQELDRRIAEARAASQKEADERVAADRAAIEKQMAEQIAAERAAAQPRTVLVEETGSAVDRLRQADALVSKGQIDSATAIYVRLLNDPRTSRDVLAGVATGLYRTGAYADAVRAFQRVGNLSRGEEDLRYYKAVSLYETGQYADARTELACALPYIPLTEDVSRYRTKIEQAGQRASLH